MDSLAAYCPWCFPKQDSEPAPGARRGPHFHYCSECGQNWRHETACSAPLRAALAECTGCRQTPAERDEEPQPELAPTMLVRPAKTFRERVRPLALPIGIAAGVLLSLPILSKGYSALRGPAVNHSVSVTQPLPAAKPQAPTPVAPPPIESAPSAPAPSAPTPIAPAPTTPASTAPTLDAARPRTEPRTAKAAPARDVSRPLPPPRISAPRTEARRMPAVEHPSEQRARDIRPRNDAPSVASPSAPAPGKADDSRIIPSAPAPSPARSEPVAESAPRTPETPPAASESGMRAPPVIVTLPAIPGAPPFSGLTGSSGRDTALDGHPRRVAR